MRQLWCQNCQYKEPQGDTVVNQSGWATPQKPCPQCGEDELQLEALMYVCADCGLDQNESTPCDKCKSVRVVLIEVVETLFGANWQDAFKEKKS